jgi:hypothetical protein
MYLQIVSETLDYNANLTRLTAPEDFTYLQRQFKTIKLNRNFYVVN